MTVAGVPWTILALLSSFSVVLQSWAAFLPASVAAQKEEGLRIFEQVGQNSVNPHQVKCILVMGKTTPPSCMAAQYTGKTDIQAVYQCLIKLQLPRHSFAMYKKKNRNL